MEFSIYKRALRVFPSFLLLSACSSLLAIYVFHIPLNLLEVVVAVPLIGLFLITRVLILSIPRPPQQDAPILKSKIYMLLMVFLFIGSLLGIDFLCSAGVYQLLGLHSIAVGAVQIAMWSGIVAAISFSLAICCIAWRVTHVMNLVFGSAEGAWRILRQPTKLANMLFQHSH